MNPDAYREMARQENRHWWFIGRRRIIEAVLLKLNLPAEALILEIGSGTGGNLAMLSRYGAVTAVEKNPWAVRFSKQRALNNVEILQANFQDLALNGKRFDLICAFDVLEHLPDDVAALKKLRALLADNGRMLLTIPAYQWLWSRHDDNLQHFRRYTRKDVLDKLQQAALDQDYISYFNCILFPVALALRCLDKILHRNVSGDVSDVNGAANVILYKIFAAERFVMPWSSMPFGLSLLAIAHLPQKSSA